MGTALVAVIRIVASLLAGYAIGDLIDHFVPEKGEASPDIREYNVMDRIVRSVRFWSMLIIGSVIAFFLLKNKLKRK